jgi:copper chaperone
MAAVKWNSIFIRGGPMEKKTLKVNGMSCEHCVMAVNKALASIDGVADIAVSLKDGTASFSHDPVKAPIAAITAAITDEGFEVAA